MQRVLFQQASDTQFQSQASRIPPGHGTGVHEQAVNDDVYNDGASPVWLVFTVLGNVIGGTLLLLGMFVLPHVLAEVLG